jgi:chemotaxis protein methyltransferase CheR
MRPEDFKLLADILLQRSGLALAEDKIYLLESRLTPIARKMGLETLDDLVAEVRRAKAESLLKTITEAMTTNESFFYRDNKPFEVFRSYVLPNLIKARASKNLRIWSAASSTGQEPYTLAMILKDEATNLGGWYTEILGTDLSAEALEKAKAGIYSQFEVQRGLPIQQLIAYFQKVGENWQIDAAIRAMVSYREFNLLDSFASLGEFDVVFCRNVLIYFEPETKAQVLGRIANFLADDGYLFLGAAETVMGITDAFKPVVGQRGVFEKSN